MAKSGLVWVGWVLGILLTMETLASSTGPHSAPKFSIPNLYVSAQGIVIAGSTIGVLRSDDRGERWEKLDVQHGWLLTQKARLLLVAKEKVFSTTDGGLSWRFEGVRQDVPWSGVYQAVDERGWLYLCHENVLRMSSDAGISWRQLTPPKGCRLARVGEKHIHVLSAGYVQSSHDGGLTWRVVEAASEVARKVTASANELFLMAGRGVKLFGYLGAERKFYLSGDGGRHWQRQDIGLPPDQVVVPVASVQSSYDEVYFSPIRDKSHNDQLAIYRTVDGSSSTPFVLPFYTENASSWWLGRGLDNALYVVDLFYIYMSTDTGKTWRRLGRGALDPPGEIPMY